MMYDSKLTLIYFSKRMLSRITFICILHLFSPSVSCAQDNMYALKMNDFQQAAAKHFVPTDVLYAICLMETGQYRRGWVLPNPWVIRYNGAPYFFKGQAEAAKAAKEFIKTGKTNSLDLGLMQVNWKWHHQRFSSVSDALDPKKSLEVAAQILSEAMSSTSDPVLGISRYHSWRADADSITYAKKVLSLVTKIREWRSSHE